VHHIYNAFTFKDSCETVALMAFLWLWLLTKSYDSLLDQRYLFYIFKLNNVIYMLEVPGLHYKHYVVLFIFRMLFCRQNIHIL